MTVAATIFGSVSSTLVATVSSPAPSSASSSTTAMFRLKRRMSVGSSRRGVVVDTVEDDNEIAEDVPIEGTIQVGRKLLAMKTNIMLLLSLRMKRPFFIFHLPL